MCNNKNKTKSREVRCGFQCSIYFYVPGGGPHLHACGRKTTSHTCGQAQHGYWGPVRNGRAGHASLVTHNSDDDGSTNGEASDQRRRAVSIRVHELCIRNV